MLPVPSPVDHALARSVDRVEILSPRDHGARDDASRAARRRDDWRLAWREAQVEERRTAWSALRDRAGSPRFAAQRLAQEAFGAGAHLDNWRGSTIAYARAQSLAAPAMAAAGISILV